MLLRLRARVLPVTAATGAALAVALASVGCSGTDRSSPGTKLGTFHVRAQLVETSCGEVPDPWEFDVRLNHDGATLYWVQGEAPIAGRIDAAGRVTLEAEVVAELRAAEPKLRRPACEVARSDRVVIALRDHDGAEAADPSTLTTFAGVLTYAFAPTEGSDCTDAAGAAGGAFVTLPCEVRYELEAHPSDATR